MSSKFTVEVHPDDMAQSPHCVTETHDLQEFQTGLSNTMDGQWVSIDARFYGVNVQIELNDADALRLAEELTNNVEARRVNRT